MRKMNYLHTIFECLNNQGLDYCIQNGYQKMPEFYPTDIDIFYQNATEEDLDEVINMITKKTGLKIIKDTPKINIILKRIILRIFVICI